MEKIMLHKENPRGDAQAIIFGLNRPFGEKTIPTAYIYSIGECALDAAEESFFRNDVGYREIENARLVSGASLFARIVADPDYYVDRAEIALIEKHGLPLAGKRIITELGPGDGHKTALILGRTVPGEDPVYQAIDVSRNFLDETIRKVARTRPRIAGASRTCCGDFFTAAHGFAPADMVLFLGTTISNFEKDKAHELLRTIARVFLKPGGLLVIGQDGNRDMETLQRCYDDGRKHTAAFVMNGLRQIRRDFLPDIELAGFRYRARFDEGRGAMMMGIESLRDQRVRIPGGEISFLRGEFIRAGQSRKYLAADIREMAESEGYTALCAATEPPGVNLHIFRNAGISEQGNFNRAPDTIY